MQSSSRKVKRYNETGDKHDASSLWSGQSRGCQHRVQGIVNACGSQAPNVTAVVGLYVQNRSKCFRKRKEVGWRRAGRRQEANFLSFSF